MKAPTPNRGSRLPAYRRIAHSLRERIAGLVYRHDEFLPPERELAREFHASRQTIRLAIDLLRREGVVVPEHGRGTRVVRSEEVKSEAEEATDRFHLAALIIYGISRDGSAAILQGCQTVIRQSDHHLIVCETPRSTILRAAYESEHLRTLLDKGIGGIIIYAEPTDRNRVLLENALRQGVPVVQIDRYLPGLPCDYVGVDNVAAAQAMVEHLWSVGHRRIAFLSLRPEASTCRERLEGYTAALRGHGVEEIPRNRVVYCNGLDDADCNMAQIVREWFAQPDPPTAVFAVNDGLALVLMQALREYGARVPEDVAVAGFDNLYAAEFVSPPLTTVQQPFAAMGETAARFLLDRMMGRYTGPPRRVLLPTQLVVRESCGACLEGVGSRV